MKTRTVVILTELSPCKNLSECMELWSFWSLALGLRSFWSFWSVGASELRSFWELLGAFGSFWELLGALGLQSFGASELRSFGASELLELWGFGAVGLWGFGVFGAFEVLELWSCGAFGTFPLCSFRRFSAVAVQESFQRFEKRIFEGYLPPTRNVDDDDDNGDSACGPSLSKSPACQSTRMVVEVLRWPPGGHNTRLRAMGLAARRKNARTVVENRVVDRSIDERRQQTTNNDEGFSFHVSKHGTTSGDNRQPLTPCRACRDATAQRFERCGKPRRLDATAGAFSNRRTSEGFSATCRSQRTGAGHEGDKIDDNCEPSQYCRPRGLSSACSIAARVVLRLQTKTTLSCSSLLLFCCGGFDHSTLYLSAPFHRQ